MIIKDAHRHVYTEIKFVPVVADNVKYKMEKHGPKALLLRECSCGASQAFGFGNRQDMKHLFNQLKGKEVL
jgi:hypothetical protein